MLAVLTLDRVTDMLLHSVIAVVATKKFIPIVGTGIFAVVVDPTLIAAAIVTVIAALTGAVVAIINAWGAAAERKLAAAERLEAAVERRQLLEKAVTSERNVAANTALTETVAEVVTAVSAKTDVIGGHVDGINTKQTARIAELERAILSGARIAELERAILSGLQERENEVAGLKLALSDRDRVAERLAAAAATAQVTVAAIAAGAQVAAPVPVTVADADHLQAIETHTAETIDAVKDALKP